MSDRSAAAPPTPTTSTMRWYLGALPAASKGTTLDERTAQAVRSVLEQVDPAWEQILKTHVDTLMRELTACLDYDSHSKHYVITGIELRGIIARAVSRTSGQLAVNIGRALSGEPLAAQFTTTQSDNETDEDDAVKSYQQPNLQQEF